MEQSQCVNCKATLHEPMGELREVNQRIGDAVGIGRCNRPGPPKTDCV